MRFDRFHANPVAKLALAACIMLTTAGCHFASRSGYSNLSPDSLATLVENVENDNKDLSEKLRSCKLDLAKSRAEFQSQALLNELLKEELVLTKSDLDQVEKQFVSLERRLRVEESKASAVSAVAEVQLLLEKTQKEHPELAGTALFEEAQEKLLTSDEMVRMRNYAAAAYYANRSMRLLNQLERRKNIGSDGTTWIVSVNRANLREGPGGQYEVVTQLKYGTVIVQLSAADDWYQVRTKDGASGWLHHSVIR